MDETKLQRWLDGELETPEAEAFLASLSVADREEAEALARIAGAARELPRAVPSEGFSARAMARVLARPPPRRSFWTWLRAPRVSPLSALCSAAAAAAVAFAVLTWHGGATPRGDAPAALHPSSPVVVARLAYRAPSARQVSVAGDFNGWNPEQARMRRGAGGVWTVEFPLAPGRRYEYMFLVDGQWVTDPQAPASVDDGYGGRNAVLDL